MQRKLIETLKDNPLSVDELAHTLDLNNSSDFIKLNKEVNKLIYEKKAYEEKGIIYLADCFKEGVVDTYKGRAYVNDLEISYDNNTLLFSGDKILYKENKTCATLIKIIERGFTYVLGTMVFRKNKLYFFSDDYRLKEFKVVNQRDFKKELKPNYKVRCYISSYPKKELKIDKVIGKADQEETIIETILLENKAPRPFSNKLLKQCEEIDETISLNKRKDLREYPFVTIDGDDAKDFDDAICVEEKEDGYMLHVSIADVTNYVDEDSDLDKEAYNRGTSIYYPGKVIPMLPFKLSDNLCSLMENKERYTITCSMHIDYNGGLLDYDIYPSVIKSKHRLTYNKVNKMFEHNKELLEEYSDVKDMLFCAYRLSRILDKLRKEKGGIEFNTIEPIIVEENGKVIDIKPRVQGKAEEMIEVFMIKANTTVASHMYYLNLPMIYRNHDYPKVDRIGDFVDTMATLGYTFKGNKFKIEASALQKCLSTFEGTNEFPLVNDMLLRSMAKALYSGNCQGHYGLGLEHYCHFTSPIRRYPDLIVHRCLKKYVFNYSEDIDSYKTKIESIANKANEREKCATLIEREIVDLKMCEYMKDKINEKFVGVISSVTSFGFFVRLENSVEGLVHVKTLDDYYEFENNMLSDGFKTYKIGQEVRVKLINVDLELRNIDFMVI